MPERIEFIEFIENIKIASEMALQKTEMRRRRHLIEPYENFSKNVISSLQNFQKTKGDNLDSETEILINEIQFVNALFREFINGDQIEINKALEALKIALKSLIDFFDDRLKKLWTLAYELLELTTLYLN